MKLNESKYQLLVCGNKDEVIIAKIKNSSVIETHEVKLQGTIIDRNLRFKSHMQLICSKVGKKINALERLGKLLPAFVMSQFAFSPLIGLFCSRTLNSMINALHYRALKLVYQDEKSSFDELLIKDKSISVHHRNIQYLAIEMFKVKLGLAPLFMADIFEKILIPNEGVVSGLRSLSHFYSYNNPRTVFYRTETLRHLGAKI